MKPILSDHPARWHRQQLAAFAVAKAAVGEPTPHMKVVQELCTDVDDAERVWRAGCYLNGYSILTGMAVWREFSWDRILSEPQALGPWLAEHWAGIHWRMPRRAVNTPQKFAWALQSYAGWAASEFRGLAPGASYDEWWKSADSIWGFGRYANIRLLELLRRWGFMEAELYDIRAVGADSPIRCLMLLEPDAVAELSTGRREIVDPLAEEVLTRVNALGASMNHFAFAAMLCEYRKAYEDRGDCPGHQTDEDLSYVLGPKGQYWKESGMIEELYAARRAVQPVWALGEVQGWTPPRRLIHRALREFGVVWSDAVYDWKASEAAGMPVRK